MALLDFDAPDVEVVKPPTPSTSALHDLVLAEDKTWHTWIEFGDFVHRCVCQAAESHHNWLVALSRGES